MIKHDIVFMYRLTDGDLTRKEIVLRVDETHPDAIVDAFQEFCICLGLEVDTAGTAYATEEDDPVH